MTPQRARDDELSFTPGAIRLAGLLPRMLGWRPGDVWSATPAELAAILSPAANPDGAAPLSRAELDHLLETDRNGR